MSKVQDKMGYMLNSKCLKGYEMKHNNLVSRILNKKKCHFCSNFVSLTKLLTTCRLDMSKKEEKQEDKPHRKQEGQKADKIRQKK